MPSSWRMPLNAGCRSFASGRDRSLLERTSDRPATQAVGRSETVATATVDTDADGIDKSVLAVAAPRRYRNREHLRSVAQAAMPHLRSQAIRPASPALPAAAGAWAQGQR